jgi:hypothetical protein
VSLLKNEPNLAIGVAAAVALAVTYKWITPDQAEAWRDLLTIVVIPLVHAVVARQNSFAPGTLEKAGLDPKVVEERAKDPMVQPFRPPAG